MAVEVHVAGRIQTGRFAEFVEAASRWSGYRRRAEYVVPRLLQGLSGEMNSVVLVFEYPDLGAYEREEERVLGDEEYVRLAMAVRRPPSLRYLPEAAIGVNAGRKRQHPDIPVLLGLAPRLPGREAGRRGEGVRTDMQEWTEIRRRVLVEGCGARIPRSEP